MSRRLRAFAVCAMLFAACTQRSDLGGQAIDASSCATSCMSMDAGVDASEVGPPERPDSRIPGEPADAATVAAFTASLHGPWRGVSRVLGPNENQLSPSFEMSFTTNPQGDGGRFDLHCVDDGSCDPFGAPGPGPDGGTFTISNLSPAMRATGTLTWKMVFGVVTVPFAELKRAEQSFGPVVTFNLGSVGAGPRAPAVRSVVLTRGPWPDAGVAPGPDAGASDAGASDAGARRDGGFADVLDAAMNDAAAIDAAAIDAGPDDAGAP